MNVTKQKWSRPYHVPEVVQRAPELHAANQWERVVHIAHAPQATHGEVRVPEGTEDLAVDGHAAAAHLLHLVAAQVEIESKV